MDGLVGGLNAWLSVAGGAVGVVAGVLGIPPLWAKARAARGSGTVTAKKILPERIRLIQRGDEIATVMGSLAGGEYLISIEGSIGVGKSAVAREVAHRLAEHPARRGKSGPFGLLMWLDAGDRTLDLTDLARALALATGDQSLTTAPADQKAQALRAHLADHPAVLVMDNLRLTASGAQQLIDFLRSLPARSVALVSANTPRRLPRTRVWLEELAEQATGELLVQESRRLGVPELADSDPATLARIHRLVGGNPRAIELFVLACARAGLGLDDRLSRLEAGKSELTDELYETVWGTLGDAGRCLLAVTAYLGVGANLEQLTVGSGLPPDTVDQGIDQLWSDGLLSSPPNDGPRSYVCATALGSFVLAQVPDETVVAVADRLARYFVERFRRDWEDAPGASVHVDAIRRVIADLHARDQHELCFELFEVTLDLFFTLGLFDDRITLGWIAYESATALGRAEQRSLALSVISSTHAVRGEHAEARRAAEEGLTIAREAGSEKEIARQLRCVGFALFRAGKADEALAVVVNDRENAEQMARDAGDLTNMIDIQSLVGAAYWHLGRLDEAGVVVRRFLEACEHLPWERGKAYAIRDLAELAVMRREFRDASLLLGEARDNAARHRDLRQQVRIDLTAARLDLFRGRPVQARAAAGTARDAARRLSLSGEGAEAQAVHRVATRAMWMLWRWLRPYRPRTRFTESTVGGD